MALLSRAATTRDDAAVVAAAEADEDRTKATLREPPPDSVRAVVDRQFKGVVAAHDCVRALERAA